MTEELKKENAETTNSMEEVLETTNELQNDPEINKNMDDMRYAFYNTSKNLFEAAKTLKPYDLLYTDILIQQAHYFLNLADNYGTLYSLAKINSEMAFNKIANKMSGEILDNIDKYANTIEERMSTLKNDVSKEVQDKVDSIAEAIKEKMKGNDEK